MIAGLRLTGSKDGECHLAFVGDETETFSVKTNNEIVELIETKKPAVLAVDSGFETPKSEFSDEETELKEEGYSFSPLSHDKQKVKRLQSLKKQIEMELDTEPVFIRFDPLITSEELAVHGDEALESLGVNTEMINSSEQFDAVLGAVTARFYQQDQFEDQGIIVPSSLD